LHSDSNYLKELSLRAVVLGLVIVACSQKTMAQKNKGIGNLYYKTVIGVKAFPFDVKWKNFSGKRKPAFEFLSAFGDGFRLTGLFEWQGNLNGPENLNGYIGFCGHSGYYKKDIEEGLMPGLDAVGA
jgi:hypothetical protein